MLAAYLVRTLEQHADKLTDELVDDLLANERTSSYRRLSRTELRQRAYNVYHHLGDWLAGRDEAEVDATFAELGRQRFLEEIPIEELVYALLLTKQHLRERIRRVSAVSSALELHAEMELGAMVSRFFDRVVYATVSGYEQVRRAPPDEGRVGKPIKARLTPRPIGWVP